MQIEPVRPPPPRGRPAWPASARAHHPSDHLADGFPDARFDRRLQAVARHPLSLVTDVAGARATRWWGHGAVLDSLDCNVAVLDEDGSILAVNTAWRMFAAANGGTGIGVGANYFVVCEAAEDPSAGAVLTGLREVGSGRTERFSVEYPCHSPDERRWFRMTATPLAEAGLRRIVVRHDDITTERLARDQIRFRGELLDAVDAAVVATDLQGVITVWNDGAQRLHGWSATEAIGSSVLDRVVPVAHRDAAVAAMATVVASGAWEAEFELARRDGTTFPAYVRDRLFRDADGRPAGIMGVAVDLSERVAKEQDLTRRNAWLRAVTDRMGDGLCTIDADGRIAYVNPRGEELLGAPADTAVAGSFLNRLLPMQPDGSAPDLSQHLIGADFVGITAGEVTEAWLLRADAATVPIEYVATALPSDHEGGSTGWVVVFRDILARLEHERELRSDAGHANWMARIQDALEHDRFVLHAQPIIDIRSGVTVQHELLIRLDDPIEGLISPAAFLPTAEAYGLAPAIDRWVVARAVELAADGHAVEVNLSARSITDPNLTYLIEQLLRDSGADPSLLVFELTETALLDNQEQATRFAQRLRAMGCQLALDDFGTGYGAFTYLKKLPVDLLKIDVEFVRDAVTDAASRHVIAAVVTLATSFGILTVAEGVEDRATLELLAEMGVDQAQGHHLGRPAPLRRITRMPGA